MSIMIDNWGVYAMKLALLGMVGLMVLVTSQAFSDEAQNEVLADQNPFEIVDQLHNHTYDDLVPMYPHLDEHLMQALMIRIVDSMKRTPLTH